MTTTIGLAICLWMAAPVQDASVPVDLPIEQDRSVGHTELVPNYLLTHGWAKGEETPDLETFLDRSYVSMEIGCVQLAYPRRFLKDSRHIEEWKSIVAATLDLHARWLEWATGKKTKGPASAASTRLAKWVKSWKVKDLIQAVRGAGEHDFFSIMGADEEIVEAASTLRAAVLATGVEGGFDDDWRPPLVLCPDRSEFVEFACLVGTIDPPARSALWVPGMHRWAELRWRKLTAIALEHPSNNPRDAYTFGQPMDARERNGLLQHFTWHAARSLITGLFGSRLDVSVEGGVATDLVIEMFGENNARAGGAATGNSTGARSTFVRGGMSHGGKLPMVSSDSQWRQRKGKDHFISVLRASQKTGMKLEHNKDVNPLSAFSVDPTTGATRHAVCGPFLGREIAEKHIPSNYLADYQDFLRAFDAAFVYWLRHKAPTASPGQSSPEAFAALLRATALSDAPFEEVAAKTYGRPVSSPTVAEGTLEGQFLKWLSRQK